MNKQKLIIGFTFAGLIILFVMGCTSSRLSPAARPIRLVITAPAGERFSGSYIADGVTNSISGIAPATISLQARDVTYEFKREGGDGEFRVALYVGDLPRISTTSDKRQGVRGQLRYSSTHESYWAEEF